MSKPCVLIPAFRPDANMIDLINQLKEDGFARILVVNDGSGSDFDPVFAKAAVLGCTVLEHAVNMGKGRALKTGFNHGMVNNLFGHGVITADADGQHTPTDISKIADAMALNPTAIVLGTRYFSGKVPLKSRLGNEITRFLFRLIHGSDVRDTQTGLRGLSPTLIPMLLTLPGERYEYEMNMLLEAEPNGVPIVQIPISTIYIEENKASHFNPWLDSMRIYALLLKFAASSLASAAVDYLVFALMHFFVPGQLIATVFVARLISSIFNFTVNKHIVFKSKCGTRRAIAYYFILAGLVLVANYWLIILFSRAIGMNVFLSKLIADILLYVVNFYVQRKFVYKTRQIKPSIIKNS